MLTRADVFRFTPATAPHARLSTDRVPLAVYRRLPVFFGKHVSKLRQSDSCGEVLSIISSAAARSVGGTVKPSALPEIFQCEFAFARIKLATATKTDRTITLLSGFNAHNIALRITVWVPERGRFLWQNYNAPSELGIAAMRIAAIAKPSSALTCGVVSLSAIRRLGSVCGRFLRPARIERRKDETNFEDVHRLSCDTVHICVFRDDRADRSRRRILHYGGCSSSSWLRLSKHGDMQGRIRRHRRHVCGRLLVQESQRCPWLSTKANTLAKRASQGRTHCTLIGRAEIRMLRPPSLASEAATVWKQ